jgi:hypothetical protein
MRPRFLLTFVGVCLSFGGAPISPARAVEPLALYDNFNNSLIDPDKWFGAELGRAGLDVVREAARRRLRMAIAAYGNTTSDSGRKQERLRLNFTRPEEVTEIAATLRILRARVQGCAANPDLTVAETRIGGSFFNSGAPTPGSHLNDVAAFIEVERTSQADGSAGPLRAHAVVRQCTAVDAEEDCSESTTLFSQNLGPVDLGKPVELLVQWDADNDQFLFQRDNQAVVAYHYTVADANAPGVPGKRLVIADVVANCTAEPRPIAFMETTFNNVRVNASAAP